MKTKKGSILAYALIILTMMAVISVAMTTTTILERKSSSATDSSTQAYQTADTGAQLGIKLINSVTAPDATLDDAFTGVYSCDDDDGYAKVKVDDDVIAGSSYELTFFDEDGNQSDTCDTSLNEIGLIKSVGTYKNTVRAVEVSVLRDPCGGLTEFVDRRGDEEMVYPVVAIGDRCWFAENLRTKKFPDGSDITSGVYECNSAQYPDECDSPFGHYYDAKVAIEGLDGSLPAFRNQCLAKIQGICPSGWHIPSGRGDCPNEDFVLLQKNYSAQELKSSDYWESPYNDGTNESGFNAVPAGRFEMTFYFGNIANLIGKLAGFLSSAHYSLVTDHVIGDNWSNELRSWSLGYFGGDPFNISPTSYYHGISVRCVKD